MFKQFFEKKKQNSEYINYFHPSSYWFSHMMLTIIVNILLKTMYTGIKKPKNKIIFHQNQNFHLL